MNALLANPKETNNVPFSTVPNPFRAFVTIVWVTLPNALNVVNRPVLIAVESALNPLIPNSFNAAPNLPSALPTTLFRMYFTNGSNPSLSIFLSALPRFFNANTVNCSIAGAAAFATAPVNSPNPGIKALPKCPANPTTD